jgi:6-phosphogluconolactonase
LQNNSAKLRWRQVMTMRVRVLLVLIVALAMATVGCGHYTCGATFGSSSCTPSGGGLGGGTTGAGAVAYPFVVNTTGTIDGYTLTQSTFQQTSNFSAPITPANDITLGVVVAQNKFLYAVYPTTQQIFGWSIDSAGNLTGITGMPITVSTLTVSSAASAGFNESLVITNPAGTLLFISETSHEQIRVYQIDSSSGVLSEATGSPFTTASTSPQPLMPENMGMDGKGLYLYVSELSTSHLGSFAEAYSVSSTGVLTAIGQFSFPGLFQMQGDPSGKFLIGTSGQDFFFTGTDDKNLYVFPINSGGSLSPPTVVPTVYAPFNIAVQPSSTTGAFVYSFSLTDSTRNPGPNPTEGYQLDTTTGNLTAVQNSPFTGNLQSETEWGQFDPGGNYMFYLINGSFVPYSVNSTGQLAQIVPSGAISPGYWTVADPQ